MLAFNVDMMPELTVLTVSVTHPRAKVCDTFWERCQVLQC